MRNYTKTYIGQTTQTFKLTRTILIEVPSRQKGRYSGLCKRLLQVYRLTPP